MTEIEVHLRNGHMDDPFHRSSETKVVCNCCPYGYHIDLDFVRFCEKLAKASGEPSLSKKMRRERRRQRQSMEVLLGLTNPVIWNIEQLLPTIAQESCTTPEMPAPTPIKHSTLHLSNDGLNKAVMDFEATLERTSKKKQNKKEVSELDAMIQLSRPVDFGANTLKRDESPIFRRSSQDMSPFVEFDMMSVYNSGGATSPGPLQNIREQMAISLKRMRELEEKVKLIPTLEIELDSLKNEKYELLEKVDKLKYTLRHTENDLAEMRNDQRRQSQTKGLLTQERKPVLRDAGVNCRVMTRDVGVTPLVQKNRTIGTETVPDGYSYHPPVNGYAKPEAKTPVLQKSTKSQVQPDQTTKSTITDLFMGNIASIQGKKEKQLSEKHLDGISFIPRSFELLNKGIQASMKEPATVLQVVEKRETGVQVESPRKHTRDVGFVAKPKTYDASTDLRPKTRDHGSSDDRTTDLLCDRCKNLKTRSVGVGLGNVKLEEPKTDATLLNRSKSFQLTESRPKVTMRHVGVGTLMPVKKLTSTKGVGTHDSVAGVRAKDAGVNTTKTGVKHAGTNTAKVNMTDAEVCTMRVGSRDVEVNTTGTCLKDAGINTVRVTVRDAGSETDKPPDVICHDPVRTEPKPVPKPKVATPHRDSEGSPRDLHPSRIPRPKSNQSTPVMERKKFVRQDTYTKLPQQPSPDPTRKAPLTKPRVKSTPDKLESPAEEKVDVILRKKFKPSLGQSPTADKSLAKDLKDLNLGSSSDRYSAHFDDYYFDYDENYDDGSKRNSTLFQPIQDESREKYNGYLKTNSNLLHTCLNFNAEKPTEGAKPMQGVIFSLRSRREQNAYLSLELKAPDRVRVVHAGKNGTQAVVIPMKLNDGHWHQLGIALQDDNSVRSFFDCSWVSTDILKRNELDHPEDADLIIGYLFQGELEQLMIVPNPGAVAQQCSTTKIPIFDPTINDEPYDMTTATTTAPASAADNLWKVKKGKRNRSFGGSGRKNRGNDHLKNNFEFVDSKKEISDGDDDGHSGTKGIKVTATDDESTVEGSGNGLSSNGTNYEVEWSEWSPCSSTCGPGLQTRYSRCVDDGSQLELCLEAGSERTETRSCILKTCEKFSDKELPSTLKAFPSSSSPSYSPEGESRKSDVIFNHSDFNFPPNPPSPTEVYSNNFTDFSRIEKHLTDEILFPSDIYFTENHTVVAKKHHGGHDFNSNNSSNSHNNGNGKRMRKKMTSNRSWDVLKKRLLRENGSKKTWCSCLNGGTCDQNGVSCTCPDGYWGRFCENVECQVDCLNGGHCLDSNICSCPSGFHGDRCENPKCDPPCRNGGTCIKPDICLCPPQTTGSYCQKFYCRSPCLNGGSCVGPDQCECPHNATGRNCENPVCEPPCENGATCSPGNWCLCGPGSYGIRCERRKCEYVPVKEPFTRGFKRLTNKRGETKCDPLDWKSCTRIIPEYQTVYKTFYRTVYKCKDDLNEDSSRRQ